MRLCKSSGRILLGFTFLISQLSRTESSGVSSRSSPAGDDGILYDLFPFVRVYKNGTVQRFFDLDFAPAGADPSTGVQSKDVKFSRNLNLTARLYCKTSGSQKRPILIYYHGGGFFAGSAFSPTYHRYLNNLVAASGVIAVSVQYRLAPEYPLPTAYQDSWLALKWAISHFRGAGREPWLRKYADFQRVYIGGDSAGGNIAHNVAIRVGLENPFPGVKFRGMFLSCPLFAAKNATPEMKLVGQVWGHAYPGKGLDDPLINPELDPNMKRVCVKDVLVFVAGKDSLRRSDFDYGDELASSGWKGEVVLVEFQGEKHVFNLAQPDIPDALAMRNITAAFLNLP